MGACKVYHSVTWVSPSLLLVWTTADDYTSAMDGRIIQSSGPLRYAIVLGMNVRDSRVHHYPPRWNAAPSQELLVIRRNHKTGEVSLGAITRTAAGKPINAKFETVRHLRTYELGTPTSRNLLQ